MLVQKRFKLDIFKKIENLNLYMFFILTIYIFMFSAEHSLFLVRVGVILFGAVLGFFWCIRNGNKALKPWLLTFLILIFWLLCAIGQDTINYEPKYMVYTIGYIWLSMLLLKNEYSHWVTIIIFIFGSGVLLQKIHSGSFYSNELMLLTSRNYVSVLMLLLVLFYYVSCHDKGKTISIIPAIVFFIISVFAIGRGGILTSAFFLSGLAIYKLQSVVNCQNNKTYKFLLKCIVILALLTIVIGIVNGLYQGYFENIFARFYNQSGMDQARLVMWSNFLSNNMGSLREFLIGSNTGYIRLDGNLHNSFLQSYASFGLAGFLMFLFLIIRAFIMGYKRKDFFWLLLYTTLLLRATTDRVFFQGYCEIFLYYFIFYWDFKQEFLYK